MKLKPHHPKALAGKGAIMILASCLIGIVVKVEDHMKDRVDERYSKKKQPEAEDAD